MKHIPIQNMACKYAEKDINGENIDIKAINEKINSSSGTKYYCHSCRIVVKASNKYDTIGRISLINTDSAIYNQETMLEAITNYCKKAQANELFNGNKEVLSCTITTADGTGKYYGAYLYTICFDTSTNALTNFKEGFIVENGTIYRLGGLSEGTGITSMSYFTTVEL